MSPASSSSDDPIVFTTEVSLRRGAVRSKTDEDPLISEPDKVVDENVVAVSVVQDRWKPGDFNYSDNSFKGALVASDDVRAKEGLNPTLEVGVEHLDKHRKSVKGMADETTANIPVAKPTTKSQHRETLRRLVRDG